MIKTLDSVSRGSSQTSGTFFSVSVLLKIARARLETRLLNKRAGGKLNSPEKLFDKQNAFGLFNAMRFTYSPSILRWSQEIGHVYIKSTVASLFKTHSRAFLPSICQERNGLALFCCFFFFFFLFPFSTLRRRPPAMVAVVSSAFVSTIVSLSDGRVACRRSHCLELGACAFDKLVQAFAC